MIKSGRSPVARNVSAGALCLAALALAAAACSSSGGNPSSAATTAPVAGPMQGAVFHGSIYVSSQVNKYGRTAWYVSKTFVYTVPRVRDCAAAAKSGDEPGGAFEVPTAAAPDPQDAIEVTGFRGPGTYPPQVLEHDKSDVIVVSQKTGAGRYDITTSGHGTKAGKEVLVLRSNGSGELVYSEAHLDGKAAGPAVAGLISWTCTS